MKKFTFLLAMIIAIGAFAQKDKKLTDQTISKASIAAHLKFLSSDAMKGRDTPSPELEIAAEYLRTQLELYGVKPFAAYPDYFQKVAMKKNVRPTAGAVTIGNTSLGLGTDFLFLAGSNQSWSGEYVVLDYASPEEIEAADVKGKMIIANAGSSDTQSTRGWFRLTKGKRDAAQKAGALGLIELYANPQLPWPLLVNYLNKDQVMLDQGDTDSDFLSLWINNPNREKSALFNGENALSLSIVGSSVERFEVNNVVGYVEGTDPELKNQYVVYSAHYDHVGVGKPDSTGDAIYNGTRDNAIGTVTVLEAAKNFGKYPNKRSSMFIMFAGEEKGLLGSEWFVEHSPLPLSDIVFCFNSDNGGYNDTSLATVIGLYRTSAQDLLIKAIETYGLKAGDDENYKEQGLFDRSDNVSFARKGIPAPSFGMGVSKFDDAIFRTYHQPSDEFETVDMDYLYTFYRAYVYAGRLIGSMKETPFWLEGDKYYEAGKALYKK